MKKILIFSLLIIPALGSFAQDKQRDAVAQTVESLRQAILDADSAKLDELTDSGLTYGHSLGKIESKKEFIGALVSGQSDFETMDITDQVIYVKNKTAVVRHKVAANIKDNGKPTAVKLAVLMVFTRDHRKWKLIARQAIRF